jgi:TonB family protein
MSTRLVLFTLMFFMAYHCRAQHIAGAEVDTFFVAVETLPEPIGGIAAIQQRVVYPELAKRAGIEGIVFVEAFINENGDVVDTKVLRGVAADTDRILDRAAQEAVRATKFRPGILRGKPVKVQISIPIRFRLSRDSGIQVIEGPKALEGSIRYPEMARRAGVQGDVAVEVNLNEKLEVTRLAVKRGIGAGCDQAVLSAVAGFVFPRDPHYQGKKGPMTVNVVVRFSLPKEDQK